MLTRADKDRQAVALALMDSEHPDMTPPERYVFWKTHGLTYVQRAGVAIDALEARRGNYLAEAQLADHLSTYIDQLEDAAYSWLAMALDDEAGAGRKHSYQMRGEGLNYIAYNLKGILAGKPPSEKEPSFSDNQLKLHKRKLRTAVMQFLETRRLLREIPRGER